MHRFVECCLWVFVFCSLSLLRDLVVPVTVGLVGVNAFAIDVGGL